MLCIWTFVHIGRPQDIFTFLMPFHIGDISAGLTILSYLLTGQHGPDVRSKPEARLFFMFVGFAALCIPFGFYPRKGVEFLFDFGIKIGIYLWLIAKLVTTEQRIQGMLKTLMFSGFAMAISAILSGIAGRIGGGATYDPNDLALVLVTTLPIAIMQGLSSNSRYWKIICLGGGALNLIGIIATRSRGGFLGLLSLGVFMLFIKLPGISKKRLIILMSVLTIVFGISVGAEYKERIQTIFEESSSDLEAGSGRIALWTQCLQIARDHPILGVGPGAFEAAFGDYLETGKFKGDLSRELRGGMWHTAYNAYLLVLTEMGIVGLLIFLAINIRSFRNFSRVKALLLERDSTNILGIQATSLQMALLGFLVCAFFLSQAFNAISYLFCFLSGAMIRITSTAEPTGTLSK